MRSPYFPALVPSDLVKIAKGRLSKADLTLYRMLVRGSPVKVKTTELAKMYGGGYFDQVKKEIGVADKDFGTLAHEVGHADLDKNMLGKIIQSRIARMSFYATPLAAAGAGYLLSRGQKWGLALPIATTVPTLVSEAWATSKGRDRLNELKATDKQLDRYGEVTSEGFRSYLKLPAQSTIHGLLMYIASKHMAA